jgi:hypothetical protein
MKTLWLFLMVSLYIVGAGNELIPAYCEQAARNILAAQSGTGRTPIDVERLALALKHTCEESLSERTFVQQLAESGPHQVGGTTTLCLHALARQLNDTEVLRKKHEIELLRQKNGFERECRSRQKEDLFFVIVSSIVSITLGWVLHTGC